MRPTPFGASDFQSKADDQLLVVLVPVKVLHIRHNLFAGIESNISLRLRANRHRRFVGDRSTFGGED